MENKENSIEDISKILDTKVAELKEIPEVKNAIVVTFVNIKDKEEPRAGFLASSLNLDTTSAVAAFLCDFISQSIKSGTVVNLEDVLKKLKEEEKETHE